MFDGEPANMKLLTAITLVAAVLPMFASAEDAFVEGGRSPDGRYEVRLVRTPDYNFNKDAGSVGTTPGNGPLPAPRSPKQTEFHVGMEVC